MHVRHTHTLTFPKKNLGHFIEGPYGNFAGRDASRGLAKNSFDRDMLVPLDGPIDKLEDLADDEREALSDWAMHFEGKYQLVGKLIENKD